MHSGAPRMTCNQGRHRRGPTMTPKKARFSRSVTDHFHGFLKPYGTVSPDFSNRDRPFPEVFANRDGPFSRFSRLVTDPAPDFLDLCTGLLTGPSAGRGREAAPSLSFSYIRVESKRGASGRAGSNRGGGPLRVGAETETVRRGETARRGEIVSNLITTARDVCPLYNPIPVCAIEGAYRAALAFA